MEPARPGTYWCPECQIEIPDSLLGPHLERHFYEKRQTFSIRAGAVWAGALAIGAILALIVANAR